MLKIGDISKICGVSIKAMRFYEKQELIKPILVDRWTGYRYYDDSSIVRVFQIVYLKDLGFSLKEIKNFNKETIEKKTLEMKSNIDKYQKSINTLQSLLKYQKGEDIMKRLFVNDDQVIGKWEKIAIVNSIEEFSEHSKDDKNIFPFENLYFLPEGEEYWVVSWTKGLVIINNNYSLPYIIKNDKMFVGIRDFQSGEIENYAVYKKIDSKKYSKQEILVEDNTNIPFVDDKNIIGKWNRIDAVKDITQFNPNKQLRRIDQIVTSYTFANDGEMFAEYENGTVEKQKWSKNVVINETNKTASEYVIKEIDNKQYLFVEWKSGDYVFGGKVNLLIVFEKN